MLHIYPAIFFHEKEGDWSVVFPDLNHLATCGDSLEEAKAMAIDCLAGYLWSEKLDGNTLPDPSEVDAVDIHCEDDEDDTYVDSFVLSVEVDPEEYIAQLG